MYARKPKPAVENAASPPFDLASWSPARIPFAEVTRATGQVSNARSSQWMIAVGAVSVAAITATVLNIDYSGPDPDKVAISPTDRATAADVRPSIDFGPGPSGELSNFAESEAERMGGSSSRNQTLKLQGVAEIAQSPQAVKERPPLVKAKDESQDFPGFSPAASAAKDRNAVSFALESAVSGNAGATAPKAKAINGAAERMALQSRRLGAGEAASGISFAPPQPAPLISLHPNTAGAKPDLEPSQLQVDVKESNRYSVTASGLPAAGNLIADDLVATALVISDAPLDDVLLLDVELADASVAPILPPSAVRAEDEVEYNTPSVDARAISHSANVRDVSPFEVPQRIRAAEENARQLASRQAIGALNETALSTGKVAPIEEMANLVQDRSEVGSADAFLGRSAQGYSDEMLPGNVAAEARSGGQAVGSLPLQIGTEALVSVRLADLISLFEDRMERPLFVWLKSSTSANEYVTFDTLRSAGIDAQFDAGTQQVALSIADDRTP